MSLIFETYLFFVFFSSSSSVFSDGESSSSPLLALCSEKPPSSPWSLISFFFFPPISLLIWVILFISKTQLSCLRHPWSLKAVLNFLSKYVLVGSTILWQTLCRFYFIARMLLSMKVYACPIVIDAPKVEMDVYAYIDYYFFMLSTSTPTCNAHMSSSVNSSLTSSLRGSSKTFWDIFVTSLYILSYRNSKSSSFSFRFLLVALLQIFSTSCLSYRVYWILRK